MHQRLHLASLAAGLVLLPSCSVLFDGSGFLPSSNVDAGLDTGPEGDRDGGADGGPVGDPDGGTDGGGADGGGACTPDPDSCVGALGICDPSSGDCSPGCNNADDCIVAGFESFCDAPTARCVIVCAGDADCPADQRCNGELCAPRTACAADSDCATGESCVDFLCRGGCGAGAGCSLGQWCDGTGCRPCDGDGDGYSAAGDLGGACAAAGFENGGDCDDANDAIYPYAPPNCATALLEGCTSGLEAAQSLGDGFVELGYLGRRIVSLPAGGATGGELSVEGFPAPGDAEALIGYAAVVGADPPLIIVGQVGRGASPDAMLGNLPTLTGAARRARVSAIRQREELVVVAVEVSGPSAVTRHAAIVDPAAPVGSPTIRGIPSYNFGAGGTVDDVYGVSTYADASGTLRTVVAYRSGATSRLLEVASTSAGGSALTASADAVRGFSGDGFWAFETSVGIRLSERVDDGSRIDVSFLVPGLSRTGRAAFGSWSGGASRTFAAFAGAGDTLLHASNCFSADCTAGSIDVSEVPITGFLSAAGVEETMVLAGWSTETPTIPSFLIGAPYRTDMGMLTGVIGLTLLPADAVDFDIAGRRDGNTLTITYAVQTSAQVEVGSYRACYR